MTTIRSQRSTRSGFTLVEMAIVLVIIGIILAAVMKGRDLLSSAEQTRQEQSYFMKWLTITNEYYKAVKRPLGDGPKYGGLHTTNGYMDNVFSGRPNVRDAIFNATSTVGIDICSLVKTPLNDITDGTWKCPDGYNPFQTLLDSEFSGKVRTYVAWVNVLLTFPSPIPGGTPELRRKNALIFENVPLAYAKRIDSTLDGTVNGASGQCLNLSNPVNGIEMHPDVNLNTATVTPAFWTSSPTHFSTTSPFNSEHYLTNTTPQDWATSADRRNRLYTVGIILPY